MCLTEFTVYTVVILWVGERERVRKAHPTGSNFCIIFYRIIRLGGPFRPFGATPLLTRAIKGTTGFVPPGEYLIYQCNVVL